MRGPPTTILIIATLLIFLAVIPEESYADDDCEFFKISLKSVYQYMCGANSKYRTAPISAYSVFASSFKINPNFKAFGDDYFGFEASISYLRKADSKWSPDFSIMKGFSRAGAGVSTADTANIYGNSIVRRTSFASKVQDFDIEKAQGYLTNVNLGTSFELTPEKAKITDMRTILGLSARYNKMTHTIGGGPGIYFTKGIFGWGVGLTREKYSNDHTPIFFGASGFTMRVFLLDLEYNLLKNFGGPPLSPVHIGTARLNLGPIILTSAARRLTYWQEGWVTQTFQGIQIRFFKNLSMAFLHDYMPNANSIVTQIYF